MSEDGTWELVSRIESGAVRLCCNSATRFGGYKVVPPPCYVCWFIIHPMKTVDISSINHSYWSY